MLSFFERGKTALIERTDLGHMGTDLRRMGEQLTVYLSKLKSQATPPSHIARGHFRHDGDTLYLRYGYSATAGGLAITLASIDVDEAHQGQGRFSNYLATIETFAKAEGLNILVECVVNPFLPTALLRRGYQKASISPDDLTNNFSKTINHDSK